MKETPKEDIRSKSYVLANALYFVQKGRISTQNRLNQLAKDKRECPTTKEIHDRMLALETWLNECLEKEIKAHPAHYWFSRIKGIGNVNIGKVVGLVDIIEASNVSKLHRYAG